MFSLSVDDEPSAPTGSAFPAFLSCKGCGGLLGDPALGAGLDLGNLHVDHPDEQLVLLWFSHTSG